MKSYHIESFIARGAKAFVVAVAIAGTLSASGQIFVASYGGYIGEYALSGSPVNPTLIPNLGGPWGMAYDGNLYVANEGGGKVGKYTTSGVTIDANLITISGNPEVIALDGSGNIFVVNPVRDTLGEYTTSGAVVNDTLITGFSAAGFSSIACDGTHLFIGSSGSGKIAEYTTSGVLLNSSLITVPDVYSIAYDGKGDLFTAADGNVGKYLTTGATVNASLVTGLDVRQFGITLDASDDIFVSNFSQGTIGEYTASGATVNAALVTGLTEPTGIVVVPEPSSIAIIGTACCALLARRSWKFNVFIC